MKLLSKITILGIAAAIQGFAMASFLFPHFIPSGGAASIGLLLNYLLNIPFAITLWLLNASLLLAAVKWLGKSSALWTLYSVTISSMTVNLISQIIVKPISNVLIDLILGSCVFGMGLGILFRMGASSGGMDILALIVSKASGQSPSKILFWINGSLLVLTGLVVEWEIIAYAVICQFIGTRILELVYKIKIKKYFIEKNRKESKVA